jgi:hypothetical protein
MKFGRPTTLTENEVESLPQVSCTVESILDVRNEMGRGQYGYPNIKEILGVAKTLPDSTIDKLNSYQDKNTKAPLPATYIFIEWKNILQKDLKQEETKQRW